MPRLLVPIVLLVAVIVAAGVALSALVHPQPGAPSQPAMPDHGSARGLTGPAGFDVTVSDVRVPAAGGRITLQVSFHNASSRQQRADPLDFTLREASGATARPVFDQACPRWTRADLHPAGGASQSPRDAEAQQVGPAFGPVPLCFAVDHPVIAGATLVWTPDIGFFGAPVPIALR